MRHRQLNVVVNFNIRHKAARDIITGIMRYASMHPEWELQLRGNHPSNDGYAFNPDARVDGLISGYDLSRTDEPDQEYIRQMLQSGSTLRGYAVISAPSICPPDIPSVRVDVDNAEIARRAAVVLMDHGLTNFAFIGDGQQGSWCLERLSHFRAEIGRFGYSVAHFESARGTRNNWTDEISRLKQWLISIPKPCGVFAAFDQRAKHVIDACRSLGINIPKEIQVIGVDNETSICELTVPSLSSISPDFEMTGFVAAQQLDRLIKGKKPPSKPVIISSTTVVERLSTTDLSRSGDRVNRAMNFIRTHCQEPIGVAETAHAVGGSVRLLEKDFKTVLRTSICRAIQDCRLAEVAKSLQMPSRGLTEIARQSGFSSATYLKSIFKKRYGMTMSEFREKHIREC